MSAARSDIDLEALARPEPDSAAVPPPRRRWLWWLVPVVLLIGFLLVFFDTARSLLEEAVPVTVVRPRAVDGETGGGAAGSVIFQAAGWVWPDPDRIRVTALAEGVVQRMLVLEPDVVKKGDPVCELVPDDARIAVDAAEAALADARAQARIARVELANAEASWTEAIEVTEARNAARADLAGRRAESEHRRAAAREGRAAVSVAEHELATQRFLRREEAAGPWQVELAQARLEVERARLSALEADAKLADAQAEQAAVRLRRAERDLEHRFAERLRLETARAEVPRADARVQQAEAALAGARLRLDRMIVRSPADGVVLTRKAHPGAVVGPGPSDIPVCHLYDPESIYVRVDVPQSQVGGARVGQRAEIRADVRRGRPYEGRVSRIVHAADIQKVTLEVRVRVLDPDGLLRPDMLCQVSVLGEAEGTGEEAGRAPAVVIPSRLLATPDSVWVVDGTTGRAARRTVRVGARRGDEVVIVEGLNLTDKVIDGGGRELREGARLQVEGRR